MFTHLSLVDELYPTSIPRWMKHIHPSSWWMNYIHPSPAFLVDELYSSIFLWWMNYVQPPLVNDTLWWMNYVQPPLVNDTLWWMNDIQSPSTNG